MRMRDIDFAEQIAQEYKSNPLYADVLTSFQKSRSTFFEDQLRLVQIVKLIDNDELKRRRQRVTSSHDSNWDCS